MCHVPTFFSLGFVFGEVSKLSDVCHMLFEELIMSDATHSQVDVETEFGVVSLILIFAYKFYLRWNVFSIFQVSRDRERFTASVRHLTLRCILRERSFSWIKGSLIAARARDHSTTILSFVQKCNWLCCKVCKQLRPIHLRLVYLKPHSHETFSFETTLILRHVKVKLFWFTVNHIFIYLQLLLYTLHFFELQTWKFCKVTPFRVQGDSRWVVNALAPQNTA